MAGKPGRSGGARAGAGRPKKARPPAEPVATPAASPETTPTEPHYTDPVQFLMAVVNDPLIDKASRVRAAVAAAGYLKKRPHDGGKKEEVQEKANAVAGGGRFTPSAPPKLARVA